jgi:3-phenylpropionate/trans-cinnamate dioxygenase ferredoxin subunit
MNNFVKVADKNDIAPGSIKLVKVGDHDVALCHFGDKFYALDDRCTHEDAPLDEGTLVDGELECPWHGAHFDLESGKSTCLPAVVGVNTYEVEVRGEEIWVSPSPAPTKE